MHDLAPNAHDHADDEVEDHDRGLGFDLTTLNRRRLLGLVAGAGALAFVAACGGDDGSTAASATTGGASSSTGGDTTAATSGSSTTTAGGTATTAATATEDVEAIPSETGGPYPGDGSNGPNVLVEDGVVRSDIRSSFGSSSTAAPGVDSTVTMKLVDVNTGTVLAGGAVYLWHADQEGRYSLYSSGVEDENYLRGVQEADANGQLSFTTIFPGCYDGRWPHMHFEVYRSLEEALSGGSPLVTSQLAMVESVCQDVYDNTAGYEQSISNLTRVSLDSDMVFSDGAALETPVTTGSAADGIAMSITVGVQA